MKRIFAVFSLVFFIFLNGCKTEHKVELEVKPVQITVDVNVRVDRELENFFGSLDEAAEKVGSEKNR